MNERYRGSLLGLACGDAVGTTLEFSSPGTFEPLTDMVGGGPFHLVAGEWTDDLRSYWHDGCRVLDIDGLSRRRRDQEG